MTVRPATLEDAAAIAEIHVRSWQEGYRGLLPDELLDGLSVERRRSDWETWLGPDGESVLALVAEDDAGSVGGFCALAASSRDEDAPTAAEITALYVEPARWRTGTATALLGDALERLRQEGRTEVIAWVIDGNTPALAAYARLGFAPDGAAKREPVASLPREESPRQVRLRARLA